MGGFLAVMNERQTTPSGGGSPGDSWRSVTFFDVDEFNDGPLFSVFIGYERSGNNRELSAISADPETGDIYVLGFDSGAVGNVDNVGTPGDPTDDNTEGDYDIYKIDFASIYADWETNFKGKDVRTLGLVDAFSVAPTGSKAATNLDYVTFAPTPEISTITIPYDAVHSNVVVRNGAVAKVGEINRNQNPDSSNFFPVDLEFVNADTLLLLDDSNQATAGDSAAQDHAYRLISRLSTTPGLATSNGDEGGYNQNTNESWVSKRLALVNRDFDVDGVTPLGHSEPQDTAFYRDAASGVQGVWVIENDVPAGGDDIAFYEFNDAGVGVGYRPFTTGSDDFQLDNDPFTDPNSNDGNGDKIFIDQDTGDLILIEASFGDTPATEVGVIRREVVNYDNAGEIQFGAWGEKILLDPDKDPVSEEGVFFERGYFSEYDSVNDKVYFYQPGNAADVGSGLPAFEMDVYVLDLTTGLTESFLNVDDVVDLFLSGVPAGDKGAFFFLGDTVVDDADFDDDDDVDGNDFLIWQRGFGVGNNNASGDANGNGVVDAADLAVWKSQFGAASVVAAGAVPEPATLGIGMLGMAAFAAATRRSRNA
jgi:hypothetical protein